MSFRAASPDPEDAFRVGLHDDRGVTMSLLNRELVHRDHFHVRHVDRPQRDLQMSFVDRFDRAPVKSEVFGHVLDR